MHLLLVMLCCVINRSNTAVSDHHKLVNLGVRACATRVYFATPIQLKYLLVCIHVAFYLFNNSHVIHLYTSNTSHWCTSYDALHKVLAPSTLSISRGLNRGSCQNMTLKIKKNKKKTQLHSTFILCFNVEGK